VTTFSGASKQTLDSRRTLVEARGPANARLGEKVLEGKGVQGSADESRLWSGSLEIVRSFEVAANLAVISAALSASDDSVGAGASLGAKSF
jgi:hypothetical protein